MAEALCQDDDLLPGNLVLLDGFADDDLGFSIGVHVGRVPGVQAPVVGRLEQRQSLFLTDDPVQSPHITEAHSPKDWDRDSETTLAELAVLDLGRLNGLLERNWELDRHGEGGVSQVAVLSIWGRGMRSTGLLDKDARATVTIALDQIRPRWESKKIKNQKKNKYKDRGAIRQ